MISVCRKSRLPAKLLLVLLLAGVQSGALAHAFEHDAGKLPNQACAICATVNQLDSSCIDAIVTTDIEPCHSCQATSRVATFESLHRFEARQRGPPRTL